MYVPVIMVSMILLVSMLGTIILTVDFQYRNANSHAIKPAITTFQPLRKLSIYSNAIS